MPIWAFQKRIIGNPTPEKAAFVSSFADCDELFVINQRFLKSAVGDTTEARKTRTNTIGDDGKGAAG